MWPILNILYRKPKRIILDDMNIKYMQDYLKEFILVKHTK